MNSIITMTTDFGLADEYAGVMKGVILSHCPFARIVDLTHNIRRHDILQAAYVIFASYGYFPESTIHLVIVDPGVGSNRRIVLVQASGHMFLAPDNGVLSLFQTNRLVDAAFTVNCDHLFLKPVSHTFHGRDIFAPVAAHLAKGMKPDQAGYKIRPSELKTISLPQVGFDPGLKQISGVVLSVDGFGNLTTNIHKDSLPKEFQHSKCKKVTIHIKGHTIHEIRTTYVDSSPGSLLAVFGSRNFIEISVNQGSAAELLDAGPGDVITLISDDVLKK